VDVRRSELRVSAATRGVSVEERHGQAAAVPARRLLQGGYRRHGLLCGAWRGQALPARGAQNHVHAPPATSTPWTAESRAWSGRAPRCPSARRGWSGSTAARAGCPPPASSDPCRSRSPSEPREWSPSAPAAPREARASSPAPPRDSVMERDNPTNSIK
jgi:hypothetical protein